MFVSASSLYCNALFWAAIRIFVNAVLFGLLPELKGFAHLSRVLVLHLQDQRDHRADENLFYIFLRWGELESKAVIA